MLTTLALLLVWGALVAPDQSASSHSERVPESPARGPRPHRRGDRLAPHRSTLMPGIVGPLLGSGVDPEDPRHRVLRGLRPAVRPYHDWSYTRIGGETLRESVGASTANLVIAGVVVRVLVLFVVHDPGGVRLTRVAAGHRRWSLRAVAALGFVWILCWVFGVVSSPTPPSRRRLRAGVVAGEVNTLRADIADHAVFAKEIGHDRLRDTPGRPAAHRPARQGRHPRVRRELRPGRGPGLLVLAGGRCRPRQRDQAAAGRRLLGLAAPSSRRRRSAASAGWRTPPCSPASGSTPSSATTSSSGPTASPSATRSSGPGGGQSMSRRRTTGPGPRAVVLPLRQDLRPAQRRLPGPAVHATPQCLTSTPRGPATPRAREAPPPPHVRRARHGLQPHAVDPHPAADRLARLGNGSVFSSIPAAPTRRRTRCGATPHAYARRTASPSSTR